jgi:hypothetical protein
MRFRSVVLPAALAVGAAVLAPTPAQAASQCALVMPTKVVVDEPTEEMDFNLTTGCGRNGATKASWNLVHNSGAGGPLDFEAEHFEQRYFYIEWYDDQDPKGNWYLKPTGAERADGTPLTQNSAVVEVKYASKLTTKVTRTSTGLIWAASATQWSGRSHKYVARPRVNVGLFHQARTGAAWTYVKSARTTSTGKATVSLGTAKTGNYRLVVGETPSVWAAYSTTVRGRI